ncbi:MAG: FkbM family methyltransferase [Lacunisphaera sp.]|nr:FkbM family methyltransferase [Lacunisphaera sp.]
MIPANLSRRIPFRLLQRLAPQARARIGPQELVIPLHDPAALAWLYWQPSWKSEIIAHFLQVRPGVLLDVGANVGQTLADFLSVSPGQPYIGLEPNPRALAFVMEVAALNSLADVTLVPLGASDRMQIQSLYLPAGDGTDSMATLRPDLRPGLGSHPAWISTAPLDTVMDALGAPALSLVKIDVEGAELEVLTGMRQCLTRSTPAILCEVLLADRHADLTAYALRVGRLADLLHTCDYAIYRLGLSAGGQFQSLQPVTAFPVAYWSHELNHACDYLFVHRSTPANLLPVASAPPTA